MTAIKLENQAREKTLLTQYDTAEKGYTDALDSYD